MPPNPLQSIASIITGLIVAAVLAFLGYLWWSDHSAKTLAVKEQAVAGAAQVNAAQAQAATNAIQIQVAGEARDHLDIEVHQSNAQAIAAAPGASAPIDPALNAAGRRGLCQHPAYAADPFCLGLRGADPAVVPPAGAAGPAP
jgi:hypothetical protein